MRTTSGALWTQEVVVLVLSNWETGGLNGHPFPRPFSGLCGVVRLVDRSEWPTRAWQPQAILPAMLPGGKGPKHRHAGAPVHHRNWGPFPGKPQCLCSLRHCTITGVSARLGSSASAVETDGLTQPAGTKPSPRRSASTPASLSQHTAAPDGSLEDRDLPVTAASSQVWQEAQGKMLPSLHLTPSCLPQFTVPRAGHTCSLLNR